jgi:hypothetical protein
MSKERALLKEIIRHFAEGGLAIIASNSDVGKTLHNAKELLAQPEQAFRGLRLNGDSYSSQEPVAWMYHWDDDHQRTYVDLLTTDAEHKHLKTAFNIRPLYTSPPKREPLSEDEILEGMKDEPSTSCRCFMCGIKFAEKAHGIGVDND